MKLINLIIGVFMILPTMVLAAETTTSQVESSQNPTFSPQMLSQVTLTPHLLIEGAEIHLGDIFQGAGKYADRVVAYAPRPGGRAIFDARWLGRVAAGYNLNWRPTSRMDRVVVERASQILRREDVENLLQDYLAAKGTDPNTRAVLSNRAFRLHLPTTISQSPTVYQMSLDPSNNRFTAMLSWGPGANDRTRLSGHIQRMIDVPVLANRLMRGDIIGQSDIQWVSIPQSRLSRSIITDLDRIVGMAAKRTITPGKPIATSDIRRPLMVSRGQTVTMVLTTPSMELTTKGRAMQSGSRGDTIRISNLQSNTIIDAVVTGSGQVRVDMNINLAMR